MVPADRNIFLVSELIDDKSIAKVQESFPNLWWILFDTNEGNRMKAHSLLTLYPNLKEAYYGFYPAEIKQYLSYLRYNIKNPPEKLKTIYNTELTNIYIQK